MGVVEVIRGGFVKASLSNNARKRHLWAIMVIENNKVKLDGAEKGLIISFSDDDYLEKFNHEHDDLIVITAIVHSYAIKRILVD